MEQIDHIYKNLSKFNEEELINNILLTSIKLRLPVALWKLPASDEKNILVEFSHQLHAQKLQLEQNISGFAVSPFFNDNQQKTWLIRPDFFYNFKTQQLNLSHDFTKENLKEQFLQELSVPKEHSLISLLSSINSTDSIRHDKSDYTHSVKKAIDTIRQGNLKKVVLSRQKEIKINQNFNPVKAFNSLCKEQPSSFVSLIYLPDYGLWLGASPELLVSIDKENIFKTVSLAGTQGFKGAEALAQTVWTQKEIEEQALVSRYIISCFKAIRLREYEEDGPKTVQAGNLVHLKTDFSVNIHEVNFPDLGSVMLHLLHPTSAVCGMPKDKAMEFIKTHEPLDRKFYSGFIGPVNIVNESHIFVNIRCAEIYQQTARLYSGAGITSESDPEKEFAETELKMQTLEALMLQNI